MTQRLVEIVTCPRCQQQSQWHGYSSVNVTLEPALKEKVLHFDIFNFSCPGCGYETRVRAPVLYNDITQRLMIQFQPNNEDWSPDAMDAPLTVHAGALADLIRSITTRRVRDLNDLREKILIFDAKLDDRVIECLKFRLKAKQAVDASYDLYFNSVTTEGVVFAAVNEKGVGQCVIPADFFAEHAKAFERLEAVNVERWPCVDAEYAASLYQKLASRT